MQSIGVDTGPEADDGITPRTMQFVSEGIQSPPAGPGMTRGSGLSATQVVAAAQNLRENPRPKAKNMSEKLSQDPTARLQKILRNAK